MYEADERHLWHNMERMVEASTKFVLLLRKQYIIGTWLRVELLLLANANRHKFDRYGYPSAVQLDRFGQAHCRTCEIREG